MEKFKGLIAAPFTPMDERGGIKYEVIDQLMALYQKNGIVGSFVGGSTGEGVSLTFGEKVKLIEKWGSLRNDQVKIIFMLGGTSYREMQELALCAKENQIDGISALGPYYFRPASEAALLEYGMRITEVVPEMPFYYYHIPALTGVNLSMPALLKLADGVWPSLAGIKFTSTHIMDYHWCKKYSGGKFDMIWGCDEALLSGLVVGAQSAIGSTYNYAAPLYYQVIAAFEQGKNKLAEELQWKAVQMVNLLMKYGGTAAGKGFMKIIGLDCGWFRAPLEGISDDKVAQLKKELGVIGFFDWCCKC